MARLSADQIVDKQIRRAQQASQDYINGVQSVTESPTAKAAAKKDKYLAGVQNAVNDGTYEASLLAVTTQDWKTATVEKGGQRWAPGVAAARPKLLKFQREYGPVRDSIAASVDNMPDDTFEQRIARMNANARGLHDQPYKRGRGR